MMTQILIWKDTLDAVWIQLQGSQWSEAEAQLLGYYNTL